MRVCGGRANSAEPASYVWQQTAWLGLRTITPGSERGGSVQFQPKRSGLGDVRRVGWVCAGIDSLAYRLFARSYLVGAGSQPAGVLVDQLL